MTNRNNIFLCLVTLLLSTQLNAQVPAYVPTDSLVGFWNFNGNVYNSLVSGISLTTSGANYYSADRNGNPNSALINGDAYQNSINGFNATNAFTIGGWVAPFLVTYSSYPSNFIGYFYKVDYEVQQQFGPPSVGTHTQFAFLSDLVLTGPSTTGPGPDYGKLYFQTVIGGITRILKSSNNYNTNTWYHVMVSYDQSYLRLYVNGDCTDSLAVTGNLDYSNATGNNEWTGFTAYVNHNPNNAIETFTKLDQMGFWRRALRPCEVLNLYQESSTNCGPTGIDAPTNLSATWSAANSSVVLNWTDNSDNENGFAIERSTDGVNFTFVSIVPMNVTTYTDTIASPQPTYYYRIYAFNMVEDSDFSNIVQVSTTTTGLNEESTKLIRCYPNPAKNLLTLEGISIGDKVTITGLTGEIILEQIAQQETTTLNLSKLASGIYLLHTANNKPIKISIQN
jgi:hypothetical protein